MDKPVLNQQAPDQSVIQVTSLERTLWSNISSQLDATLSRLNLLKLSSPTMLILHDLIEIAVRKMHHRIFTRLAEEDFGMGLETHANYLDELYAAEVAEHGSQNIARYCQQHGYHIGITFRTMAKRWLKSRCHLISPCRKAIPRS